MIGGSTTAVPGDWLALSDLILPEGDLVPLAGGLFVCEFALPLAEATVLLHWQENTGDAPGRVRTFAIFADPQAGVVVMHREGAAVRRHRLPGPLPFASGAARITYGWNRRSGRWDLTWGRIGNGCEMLATGPDPIPLCPHDLAAMSRREGAAMRHASLLWFGVTRGSQPPQRAPWVGLRTPIETARGPVAAGALRVGDLVRTCENGLQPVLRLNRLRLPSRGSFAPVILRAPFLGQGQDMLLAADQLVALGGAEVEYMFGDEEVLIRAGALANGSIAVTDERQAATDCIAIDLGLPELVLADGLKLLSHGIRTAPPLKVLEPYEAQQLVALMARRSLCGAA